MTEKTDMIGVRHGVWIVVAQSNRDYLKLKCTRCGATCGSYKAALKRDVPVYHFDCNPPDIDNDKRIERDNCKECKYWRHISMASCACHYLLDNDSSRPRNEDGSCAGWEAKHVEG